MDDDVEPQDAGAPTPPTVPPSVFPAPGWPGQPGPTAPPSTPTIGGPAWSVPTPHGAAPHGKKHRSGCLSGLVVLLVLVLIVGAAVFVLARIRRNDPDRIRAERRDDLVAVCRGEAIDTVLPYERGAAGQLGARFEADEDGDEVAVAFPLVPTEADVSESFEDVRVVACASTDVVERTTCSFRSATGPVTASWTTKVQTQVRIRDVHSGTVIHEVAFPTSSSCPSTLQVDDEGSYTASLPERQIAEEVEAQLSLYHQG